jgi:hypothetical protein
VLFDNQNKRNRSSLISLSDLEVEMPEATNMRVVSFAQDLIYDVTRCKVQIPEHVGLAVLLKYLTGLPGNMFFVCFCIASFVGGS